MLNTIRKKVLINMMKEKERLYPQKNFVFHQNSAPSHTPNLTIKCLKGKKK